MAIEAKRRSVLGQVLAELALARITDFVGDVAGAAAHIHGGVATALLRHVQTDLMTTEAKILVFPAGHRLQELLFVRRLVGIVALNAVANRWTMDAPLDLGSVLVSVAGKAELSGGSGGQLYASYFFITTDLVTAGTAHGDGTMNVRAFGLIFMTFQALSGISLDFQGNWVLLG